MPSPITMEVPQSTTMKRILWSTLLLSSFFCSQVFLMLPQLTTNVVSSSSVGCLFGSALMLQCLQSSEYSAKVPPAGCPQQTNNTHMPSQSVASGVWTPEPKVQTHDNFPINVQTESSTSIPHTLVFGHGAAASGHEEACSLQQISSKRKSLVR